MEKVLLSPYGRLLFKVHRGDQVGRSVNLGSDRSSERFFFARHGMPEEVVSEMVLSFLREHFRASVGSMVLNISLAAHFIHSPMGKQREQ